MNKSLKLRYVNQLVGSLVLAVVALLIVGLVLVARRQELFVRTYELRAALAEKDLGGLRQGSQVMLLGRVVGTLRAIEYAPVEDPQATGLLLRLSMREDPEWPIYAGSVAQIKRHLAGAGEAFLEIQRPERQQQVLTNGDTIPIQLEPAATDRLDAVVTIMERIGRRFDEVRDSMVPAFEQFQSTTEHLDQTNSELGRVVGDFQQFSPQLAPLTAQARGVLDASQEVVDALREETDQLPGTVDQFQGNLSTAQDVLDGMRSHWLLRRYIDSPDESETIAPAAVGRGDIWP